MTYVRASMIALMVVACAGLGGCGYAHLLGRAAPEAARLASAPVAPLEDAAPLMTRAERDRAEARSRSALAPREPYWPYRLAQRLADADSLGAAESELRIALDRDASYAPALALLSKLLFGARRHTEAVTMLEAARARGPVPDELLAGLAMHYDALDQPERARAVMATLAEPGRASTRPARVFVMLRGDTPEDAAREAVAAVADDPKNAVHQNNFGITKLRTGDVPAARAAFLAAIGLDPKLPGPYYNLAILEQFYTFDEPAARRWFDAYWQRSQDDPDSLQRALGSRHAKDSDDLAKQGGGR